MERQENTQSIISALDEIMKDDQILLPLQRDVLEQFKADPENHQTGIFDLATGFGKTCVMSVLMTAYLRNNPKGKVIIAVPTQTLIENEDDGGHLERMKEFFKSFNQRFSSDPLDIGAFYSERKEPEKQVVITTYNSLNNLRKQINPQEVGLLLLDEAHHTITDKRIAAVESFTNAAQYGMTATPFYSPEKSLSMVLGGTIAQVDVKKAIQTGLLSNVKNILMVSDISVDLASELGQKQDYNEENYEKAIEKALKASSHTKPGNSGNPKNWEEFRKEMAINVAKLYRDYVDENLGPLNGKQCMINCRTQEEARIQAKAINTLFGKEVAGGWTSDSDDKTVLNRFAQKKLNVICQVGKLAEGFDDPDIAVCINYPTASQVLEEQRSGRPLHKVQNTKKEALLIDLCFRHPDYDNEVDAIRQNNQKLFMDILGAPVVRCEEIAGEKQPDREARPVLHKHTTTLPQLHGFHIISNTQELIRLTREADILLEKRAQEEAELRDGVTSGAVAKILGIKMDTASKLIDHYEGKTVINPETGKEEPCTKMMKNTKGKNCLGFTKLGWELVMKKWQEEHEGVGPAEVVKKLHIKSKKSASNFIKSYEGRTVLNPETGKEEPCTKMVKNANGKLSLGFTKLGLEKAKREYEEQQQGFSPTIAAGKIGCCVNTAAHLIKKYKDKKVINPETGKEESCTKEIKTANGKLGLGFTKLGLEKALKEYKEKQERTTSPTLRPRLKAGSTQGKPKAPPVRQDPTPEI